MTAQQGHRRHPILRHFLRTDVQKHLGRYRESTMDEKKLRKISTGHVKRTIVFSLC